MIYVQVHMYMLKMLLILGFFGFFPDWSYLNSLGNLVDIIVKSRRNLVQFFFIRLNRLRLI